ncbi:hypothetical protein HDU86_006109 [Geranomyces michiganensis]|nr:hypothetical protein HDU86_006109 [Geranomyces michiganensis]
MGLTMSCCVVVVLVTQLLDTNVNQFVIPTTLITGTFWTFLENAFELLTIFQRLNSAASSAAGATQGSSRTRGKMQSSGKALPSKPNGTSASDLEC